VVRVVCLLGRRRQEDVNVKQCLSMAERVGAVCVCSERRGWESR
jgi:hypothetical protein